MRRRRSPEVIGGRLIGASGAINAGDGFTVTRTAAGTYVVTFAPGFRLVSAAANVEGAGTTAFTVRFDFAERTLTIYTYGAGALADANTSFVATGVQT